MTKASIADDGTFVAFFTAPDDTPGEHVVTACVAEEPGCDPGDATAMFTLDPEPKPTTEPPIGSPTARPPVTEPPATPPPPTRTPGFEPPPIIVPPEDELPPVPWLAHADLRCAEYPFTIHRPYNFESDPSSGLWVITGERAEPPAGARSGTLGLASVYDDFGSVGRPIVIDFAQYPERGAAVFVGREAPRPGAGPITAVLTAYGVVAGDTVELARATTVLEEAPIATERCLKVVAPPGTTIRTIAVEYLDMNGASSTERRWIDDLHLEGSVPPPMRGDVPPPEVTITSPIEGTTINQPANAPLTVIGQIRYFDSLPPSPVLTINGQAAGPLSVIRAPHADPFTWQFSRVVNTGLLDNANNEIRVDVSNILDRDTASDTSTFRLATPVAGNLRVVEIEVNQAIQVPGNLVPLIGDKRTVVRVLVEGTPDVRGPWGPVTGRLITLAPDGVSRHHSPIAPTTPLPGPVSRFGPQSQLLFVLDRPETAAGRLHLEVQLQPITPRVQTHIADDSARTSVTFVEPLRYTVFGVLFSAPNGETNDWSKLEEFLRYTENVFPVSSAQVVPVPGIGRTPQLVADIGALRDRTGALLARLSPEVSIYGLWPGERQWAPCPNPDDCFAGQALGRRADGRGDAGSGRFIMAQELAHAEDLLWHAETPGEPADAVFGHWNPAWPWPHTGIGHVGMDTSDITRPVSIRPWVSASDHVHDFMSYAGGNQWVSPYTYCVLLEKFTRNVDRCPPGVRNVPAQEFAATTGGRATTDDEPAVVTASARHQPRLLEAEVEYLLVRGEIAWDAKSAMLEPVESIYRAEELPLHAQGEAFHLEIVAAGGDVLLSVPFTPPVTHGHDDEPVPFSFTIARPDDAAGVRLMRGDEVLAARTASPSAPVINFNVGSGSLDEVDELTWTANDPDGDALVYAVEVSTDDRRTWLPLAAGLTEPATVFDAAAIAAAEAVWLRVYASDGFHTTIEDAGPFTVSNHAPTISLVSPPDGTAVDHSTPILLEAMAADVDDDVLDGASITWVSDRDGAIGEGRWLTVEDLSVGEHAITVTATDTGGKAVAEQVHVTVRAVSVISGSPVPSAGPNATSEPSTAAAQPTLPPASVAPADNTTNVLVLGIVALLVGSLLGLATLMLFGRR